MCDFKNGVTGKNKMNIVNSNNSTNITNNTFNVVINSYDDTERIMRSLPKLVCNWIRQDQINYGRNETKWTTGSKMLTKTHTHPPNRNIRVSNERSRTLEVYEGGEFQKRVSDEVVDECLLQCKKDLEFILKDSEDLISKSQLMSAIEGFSDTLSSTEYKNKHKRNVLNTIYSIK